MNSTVCIFFMENRFVINSYVFIIPDYVMSIINIRKSMHLPNVPCLATAINIARPVAETFAEIRIEFCFSPLLTQRCKDFFQKLRSINILQLENALRVLIENETICMKRCVAAFVWHPTSNLFCKVRTRFATHYKWKENCRV